MRAISKEPIRQFSGKIIGYLETDKDGNQQARDFYGKILGTYDKKFNVTRDFYGKIVGKGNQVIGLIWNPQVNNFLKQNMGS